MTVGPPANLISVAIILTVVLPPTQGADIVCSALLGLTSHAARRSTSRVERPNRNEFVVSGEPNVCRSERHDRSRLSGSGKELNLEPSTRVDMNDRCDIPLPKTLLRDIADENHFFKLLHLISPGRP